MSTQGYIEEFFTDVDETLDRLIENAETLEEIEACKDDYEQEIETLESMQESLINHLMNLEELMEHDNVRPSNQKVLKEKVKRYSELNEEIIPTIGKRFSINHDQLKLRKSRKGKVPLKRG